MKNWVVGINKPIKTGKKSDKYIKTLVKGDDKSDKRFNCKK